MQERRRWTILVTGTYSQAATCAFIYSIPLLVPILRDEGLSLFQSSLVVASPAFGVLLTLFAWGAAADRYGEKIVISTGVGLAALFLAIAAASQGPVMLSVLLALAGACGASVNAAGARVVMGWFPVHERGLAMGIRQTAQPIGVAMAALALPGLGRSHGAHLALLFPALLCLIAAVAVVVLVQDPPRAIRAPGSAPERSPYRDSWHLQRVHLASTFLVVPQFAVSTFMLVYLVGQRHWDPAVAGRLIFGFQLAGAAGRVAAGVWSDRVNSRLRPMRQLAVASAALMAALGLGALLHQWWITVVFGVAAVVTVGDNALGSTSSAEIAGTAWAGRALGLQNTLQNVFAVITAPVLAAIIGDSRYALAFSVVAVFPALAVFATPVAAERRSSLAATERQQQAAGTPSVDASRPELAPTRGVDPVR